MSQASHSAFNPKTSLRKISPRFPSFVNILFSQKWKKRPSKKERNEHLLHCALPEGVLRSLLVNGSCLLALDSQRIQDNKHVYCSVPANTLTSSCALVWGSFLGVGSRWLCQSFYPKKRKRERMEERKRSRGFSRKVPWAPHIRLLLHVLGDWAIDVGLGLCTLVKWQIDWANFRKGGAEWRETQSKTAQFEETPNFTSWRKATFWRLNLQVESRTFCIWNVFLPNILWCPRCLKNLYSELIYSLDFLIHIFTQWRFSTLNCADFATHVRIYIHIYKYIYAYIYTEAIKRLRTRSAAVRHWRDFGLKRLRTRSCHEWESLVSKFRS